MGEQQEMTLQEWVERLPKIHSARQEYAELRTKLTYGLADLRLVIMDLRAQLVSSNNLLQNISEAAADDLGHIEVMVRRLRNMRSLCSAQIELSDKSINDARTKE